MLIDHILNYDIKYRLAIEEIYTRLEASILDKMKNVEREIRSFVYSYRDNVKLLKDRYASDTSNWKEEEFMKRKDNLA